MLSVAKEVGLYAERPAINILRRVDSSLLFKKGCVYIHSMRLNSRHFYFTEHMALKKEDKVKMQGELETAVGGAESVVFVNFNKLTVFDVTNLRKNLRDEGTSYKVVKKTLLKRALDAKKIEGDMPDLVGEVAIAYSTDAIAPARGVYAFQKDHKDNVTILGGVFGGKYMNQSEMTAIATIPPREVLLSQIAYLLKSPMQRLALAVNAVAEKKA
jgi:large subunit ribosomal protein L10